MNDDSLDNRPIDLSSLDPTRDAAHVDALVRTIARDGMFARAGRAARPADLLSELADWMRPALAAAAIVLVAGVATLAATRRDAAPSPTPASATDVLGIPRELMDLLHSPGTPSLTQIDDALASANRVRQ